MLSFCSIKEEITNGGILSAMSKCCIAAFCCVVLTNSICILDMYLLKS